MNSVKIKLIKLGLKSYGEGLEKMKLLESMHDTFLQTGQGVCPNALITMTHPPTYTVGTRDGEYNDCKEKERLVKTGAEFYYTDRGGLITFHGPGQLVCYPVLNLSTFSLKPRQYVHNLEQVMIDTCQHFNISASRDENVGIWVGNDKIGALGVHIRNRLITTHGIALNCNIDLSWFRNITACGLKDKGTTSISHQLKSNVSVDDVLPVFLENFNNVFHAETLRELHQQ